MQENPPKSPEEQKRKSYLALLRGLPEWKRKIIFWIIIIIVSLILFNFYFKSVGETFKKGMNLPEIEAPKIELPETIK